MSRFATRRFDTMKVVKGSERNALVFPCGIKPCRTPVQVDRYIDIRCDIFAVANVLVFLL